MSFPNWSQTGFSQTAAHTALIHIAPNELQLRPGLLLQRYLWAMPPTSLIHSHTTAPPWLRREICLVGCPWAARGWPAPPWASLDQHGAAAECLELFLHWSLCLKNCFSLILSVFPKSAPLEHNQHCSGFSSGSSWSTLEQLQAALIWYRAALGSALRVTPAAPHYQNTATLSTIHWVVASTLPILFFFNFFAAATHASLEASSQLYYSY